MLTRALVICSLCLVGSISHADTNSPASTTHVVAKNIPGLTTLRGHIQRVWRKHLRRGVTSVYIVDAVTGEKLYGVHEDVPLNPASNVKLISTGTVLSTLGPDWRYETQLWGNAPDKHGTIRGDVFLRGNHDPTLQALDFDELATALVERGVRKISGDVLVGDEPTRDTLATKHIRVTVEGQQVGTQPAIDVGPFAGYLRATDNHIRTHKRGRTRVRLRTDYHADAPQPFQSLSLRGRIRKGHTRTLYVKVREPSTFTAFTLAQALQRAGITVSGQGRVVSASVSPSGKPLATHLSQPISALVARVNKRSLNAMSDRLVMTAAQQVTGNPPNMSDAVDLMKSWLKDIGVDPNSVVLDTGSGLSYATEISTQQIVQVLRAAAGFAQPIDTKDTSEVFQDSLAVAHTDGTLRHRFRTPKRHLTSLVQGKTGTLSTVIALSGFITRENGRTLCFAIVTNGKRRLRKRIVRSGHERIVAQLDTFLQNLPLHRQESGGSFTASP